MDADKLKRRQSLRVVVSEAIMVVAVILIVVALAFIVSGYWLNSDFKVERQGMLQIYSTPTGATVEIDGESSWLQRTNTSKVLSSGEHTVTLTKDGYDSWSKTFSISEGLLYRIHYPRLFLKDRVTEKVLNTKESTMATISADHETLILINNTTKWSLINLKSEKISPVEFDIAKYFSGVSLVDNISVGIFSGEILDARWDSDGTHVLFKTQYNNGIEWVLIDVKDVTKSVNLTKEFGANFDEVEILDNSSNNLLAVQNGNLRKIDVSGRQISATLASGVIDFDHYNSEVVFSASTPTDIILENMTDENGAYYIGYFKVGDTDVKSLEFINSPAKVLISRFYDDKLIAILKNNDIEVYKKDNFERLLNFSLNFAPGSMIVGNNGGFVIMYTGSAIATLDMEAETITEWSIEGEKFGWLDNNMIYTVNEGDLIVYDYDGLNRRTLAKNISNHFPVGITENKWLYYFSDDELVREWLVTR